MRIRLIIMIALLPTLLVAGERDWRGRMARECEGLIARGEQRVGEAEAIGWFRQAVRTDPTQVRAHVMLAEALFGAGRGEQAAKGPLTAAVYLARHDERRAEALERAKSSLPPALRNVLQSIQDGSPQAKPLPPGGRRR